MQKCSITFNLGQMPCIFSVYMYNGITSMPCSMFFSVQEVVKRSEGAGRNEQVQWAMYIVQCGMGNGQCTMGISGIDFDAIVQVRWTQ